MKYSAKAKKITIKIGGEDVLVSSETVASKPGSSSSKTILRSLKDIAKKSLFPQSSLVVND